MSWTEGYIRLRLVWHPRHSGHGAPPSVAKKSSELKTLASGHSFCCDGDLLLHAWRLCASVCEFVTSMLLMSQDRA